MILQTNSRDRKQNWMQVFWSRTEVAERYMAGFKIKMMTGLLVDVD